MKAKLMKSLTAVLHDVPGVLVTIPAGATVEFQPTAHKSGVVDVTCEGKLYTALLEDLFDAARPMESE
jgi:hypothetical protein